MKVLFNKSLLDYNQNSNYEGSYRIKEFSSKYPDTNTSIDPIPFIISTHTEKYLNKIKKSCEDRKFYEKKNELVGLELSPDCFKAALLAVALTIEASQSGNFAVIRPPGHHASKETPSGFCLFNNMAIATNILLSEGKRVAILDIDGHHGDGTEKLLKGRENVLFCSIHESRVFPGTGFESKDNILNFPLKPPISEDVYMQTFENAVSKLKEFNPEVIGVSAGFDTFQNDKLLDFELTLETYFKIGSTLKENFENIFAVLEGGYHNSVMECVESFISGANS